ncbi:MAG TPA: EFR1 family ferrodoxin [Anaerovoracaceae bacterium]|nr:EFR1 family ferrodoxin [Anaerovoracaceae bacterium]
MEIKKIWAAYFSATGTTKKVVEGIAAAIADRMGTDTGKSGPELEVYDFTLPDSREKPLRFGPGDLVVFGTPVYAGRVPNVLLKYLDTIEGNGAAAVPVVLYGNRDYDDALIELRDILEKAGLHIAAAAAFIGEHSFSSTLAGGRPDNADMAAAFEFAEKVTDKIAGMVKGAPDSDAALPPVDVKGIPSPYRGYYQPRDRQGNPVDIRKVKPLTGDACTNCLICADICPMGSVSRVDVGEFTGICIKCGACIKKCPVQAKYYEDEGFLYHKRELEEGLTRRAEPEWFL